jgi:hypothetical protein
MELFMKLSEKSFITSLWTNNELSNIFWIKQNYQYLANHFLNWFNTPQKKGYIYNHSHLLRFYKYH